MQKRATKALEEAFRICSFMEITLFDGRMFARVLGHFTIRFSGGAAGRDRSSECVHDSVFPPLTDGSFAFNL